MNVRGVKLLSMLFFFFSLIAPLLLWMNFIRFLSLIHQDFGLRKWEDLLNILLPECFEKYFIGGENISRQSTFLMFILLLLLDNWCPYSTPLFPELNNWRWLKERSGLNKHQEADVSETGWWDVLRRKNSKATMTLPGRDVKETTLPFF